MSRILRSIASSARMMSTRYGTPHVNMPTPKTMVCVSSWGGESAVDAPECFVACACDARKASRAITKGRVRHADARCHLCGA